MDVLVFVLAPKPLGAGRRGSATMAGEFGETDLSLLAPEAPA